MRRVPLATFEFRRYQPDDRDPIVTLIGGCYAEYGEVLELETLDSDLLSIPVAYAPPHEFRVVCEDGVLFGTVAVKMDGEEAHLRRLFLDRAYRGRGIGKALTVWAFDFAREHGARLVHIWSDVLYEDAHALYRHLGADDPGKTRLLGGANDCWERYFVKRL